MTGFLFPEFDVHVDDDLPTDPAPEPIAPPTIAARFDSFGFRVRQFTQGLPAGRRREIDARPRFYSLAWLRRADEPDSDDFLP